MTDSFDKRINKGDTDNESRKSLIDEFKNKLAESDINYYAGTSKGQSQPLKAPNETKYKYKGRCQFWNSLSKKKKMIAIIGAALILIAIIILIIVLAVSKSSNPDDPSPPVVQYATNPYVITKSEQSSNGGETFTLNRDKTYLTSQKIATSVDNSYIDQVQISVSQISYETLRLQITDQSNPNQYRVSESYLSSEYLKYQQQGLNFSLSGFRIASNNDASLGFGFQLYDINTNTTFLDTSHQNFVMMSSYQEIGFMVDAVYFYGLGERFTNFSLNEGSYTLFPYFNGKSEYDTGKTSGNQLYGQHPFLMMKLTNDKFMGIFLFNSNPQQFSIKKNDTHRYQINIITTGGIMDLFIFHGFTYADVVKQYQEVIGKPKMLPLWAHAFQSRSSLYTNQNIFDNQVYNYSSVGLKVEVVGLPINAMNKYTNFDTSVNTNKIREEGLELAIPYFYFVPDNEENKDTIKYLKDNKLTVQSQGESLQVNFDATPGVCVDFFNPNIGNYIKKTFTDKNVTKLALWLDQNTPFVDSYKQASGDQPFDKVPYLPFNRPFGQSSFPAYAQHTVAGDFQNPINKYHYDLHGLYGTQMAKVLTENLPSNSFVISSSTFPGSGKMGIAHQLPTNEATWQNLRFSLNNLMNFHMFGIPYTSHNICGYSTSIDEQLCVRSFQLSVLSPLAILNQNSKSENDLPYKLSQTSTDKILQTLIQRTSLLVYQRTELYRISQRGGVLAQLLSVVYPGSRYLQNHTRTVEFIMYGNAIKADYLIGPDVDVYDSYFPENFWLPLRQSADVLINATAIGAFVSTQKGNNVDINLYQKPGTIVPIVGSNAAIDRVQDLGKSPLHLSILVDQHNNSAKGFVLLESGNDLANEQEYYEITHQSNMISFKQQNSGSFATQNNKHIDVIRITGSIERVEFACVLKKDLKTTQTLYIKSHREQANQVELSPANKPQDQTKLYIHEIEFIFYSSNITAQCGPNLFRLYQVDKAIKSNESLYYAQIRQNLKTAINQAGSSKFYDTYLNITLLSDNSLYIFFAKSQLTPYSNTPIDIYDRSFSQFASEKRTVLLSEILTINVDPFYIELHEVNDTKKVIWSTQDQILIFHDDFHMFNYIQPQSDGQRFFGLQERKGKFFLQDQYTYSLYTNNLRLEDKQQAQGRTIQHGRNGAHPIVFSQFQDQGNLNAYLSFIPSGVDFTFYKTEASPRISHVSPQTLVESVFIFNLAPADMTKAIHKHIQFGDKFMQTPLQQAVSLPPLPYALGLYLSIVNFTDPSDFRKLLDDAKRHGYPFEGMKLDEYSLEGFESLTFDPKKFNNDTAGFLKYLQDNHNLKIFNMLKSGLSQNFLQDDKNKKFSKFVNRADGKPMVGKDETGNIQFLDFTALDNNDYFTTQIDGFKSRYNIASDAFGIQLNNNEIYNNYCDSECSLRQKQENQMIYKVGTNQQFQNNVPLNAKREAGSDSNIHNLNGLLESLQMNQKYQNLPFTSTSTALGFGKISNAGKMIYQDSLSSGDAILTLQTIQSLGIMGMSFTGLTLGTQSKDTIYSELVMNLDFGLMLPLIDIKIKTNQLKLSILEGGSDFRPIICRYMMILYTQTQLFKSANLGHPFIQPLFYMCPKVAICYDQIDQQYMYGPSFKVQVYERNQPKVAYFPQGVWCQIYTIELGTPVQCFNVKDQTTNINNQTDYVYIQGGTITPLQNTYSDKIIEMVTTSDLANVNVDLHLILDDDTQEAQGDLYLNSNQADGDLSFCFFKFTFKNDVLTFEDASLEMKSVQACQESKEEQKLGDIIIYRPQKKNYKTSIIYTLQETLTTNISQDQLDPNIAKLEISKYNERFSNIKNITFQ